MLTVTLTLLAATGCGGNPSTGVATPTTGRVAVAHTGPSSPPTAPCRTTVGRPDPSCTPGAVDPTVRDDNVHSTVCVSGYSARHRPELSVTTPIKRERMTAYGFGDRSLGDFELDHLVPISLGGDPTSAANLWVQFNDHPSPTDENSKDRLERVLFGQVCAGRVPLSEARRAIATDWPAAFRRYVGPLAVQSP